MGMCGFVALEGVGLLLVVCLGCVFWLVRLDVDRVVFVSHPDAASWVPDRCFVSWFGSLFVVSPSRVRATPLTSVRPGFVVCAGSWEFYPRSRV